MPSSRHAKRRDTKHRLNHAVSALRSVPPSVVAFPRKDDKARFLLETRIAPKPIFTFSPRTTMATAETDITPRGGTRVVCRVRPLANSTRASCVASRGAEVTLVSPAAGGDKPSFAFDEVFAADASNEDVFRAVRPTLEDVKKGINGAVLAYGQSGAGKSHTMNGANDVDDLGVVQRAIADLVSYRDAQVLAGETCRLTFSALELYNERLVDLITGDGASSLNVVNDPKKGVWPRGAAEIFLGDDVDIDALLNAANKRRATASTDVNKDSSRSHLIVILRMETRVCNSKLFLVDLAGCEQVRRSGAAGPRLDETCGINKSLSALGNVVAALTAVSAEKKHAKKPLSQSSEDEADENEVHKKKTQHVPYRDSKLTFLLSEALGGNARAVLIMCLSPDPADSTETLSTLRFGARAGQIVPRPKRNTNPFGDGEGGAREAARQIDELTALVAALKTRLAERDRPLVEMKQSSSISNHDNSETGNTTRLKPFPTIQLWIGLCVAYFAVDVLVLTA
mmetsp:Transcript_4301/g.15894  ORF Transcript_4301/g.15894 Transcript_4301/m.15894 type:complete len:511 (+) Transcript_4301:1932-3464(+)